MKQVKLRTWDGREKRWLDIDGLRDHTYFAAEGCDESGICTLCLGGQRGDEDIDWLFYIGEKDKNNQDIYAGDIVKVVCECGHTQNMEVVYVAPGFKVRQIYQHRFPDYVLQRFDRMEIIGNVKEHKHLLRDLSGLP